MGGLHAAGALEEFVAWATTLTQRSLLRLLDPSIAAAGSLRAEKILDAVRDMLGDTTIENLPIPYTAVATDLIAGKSVWLQRGPLDAAIRASIAIPGVISRICSTGDCWPTAESSIRCRWHRRGCQRRPHHRRQSVSGRYRQRRRRGCRRRADAGPGAAEPVGAQHLGALGDSAPDRSRRSSRKMPTARIRKKISTGPRTRRSPNSVASP